MFLLFCHLEYFIYFVFKLNKKGYSIFNKIGVYIEFFISEKKDTQLTFKKEC